MLQQFTGSIDYFRTLYLVCAAIIALSACMLAGFDDEKMSKMIKIQMLLATVLAVAVRWMEVKMENARALAAENKSD